jgi:hypothetical protein
MNDKVERVLGLALLLLLVVHVTLVHEGPWVLLAACDTAAVATGLGLLCGWRRLVALALVFQVSVGFPAFLVGVSTTFVPIVTSVAVHLLPMIAGGLAVIRGSRRLPPRAALATFLAYVGVLVASLAAPAALNLNLLHAIWPPVARLFPGRVAYHAVVHGLVPLAALVAGETGLRRLVLHRVHR